MSSFKISRLNPGKPHKSSRSCSRTDSPAPPPCPVNSARDWPKPSGGVSEGHAHHRTLSESPEQSSLLHKEAQYQGANPGLRDSIQDGELYLIVSKVPNRITPYAPSWQKATWNPPQDPHSEEIPSVTAATAIASGSFDHFFPTVFQTPSCRRRSLNTPNKGPIEKTKDAVVLTCVAVWQSASALCRAPHAWRNLGLIDLGSLRLLLVEIMTKPLTQACLTPDWLLHWKAEQTEGEEAEGPGVSGGLQPGCSQECQKVPAGVMRLEHCQHQRVFWEPTPTRPVSWAPRGLETAGTGQVHRSSRFHGKMAPGHPEVAAGLRDCHLTRQRGCPSQQEWESGRLKRILKSSAVIGHFIWISQL